MESSPPIDQAMLEEIVRLLVEAARPRRIILFGSYARGDQDGDSDLDLLIAEEAVANPAQESVRLRRALTSIHMPIDIIVRAESDLQSHSEWLGTAIYEALRDGRQLKDTFA